MNFELFHPWIFLLLPLPIIAWILLPSLTKRRSALISAGFYKLIELTDQDPRKAAWVSKRNWLGWMVLILVWCLILCALSGPHLTGEPEMKIKTARSFLIAADISFSMDIRDWEVDGVRMSRWDATKNLMADFIKERKSDQIGLIFFGTNAYLQAPLTTDLEIVEWMLNETEVGMAGQMTGIGNAIGMAMRIFEQDTLDEKILFLLTDGVDSGSEITPIDAAGLAKQDSITIYTLGIGDPAGSNGDLDERTLKEIASITGGRYFQAIDQTQAQAAYDTIDELEPIEFEEESYQPSVLLYYYPVVAAILVIILYSLIIGVGQFVGREIKLDPE